MLTKQSSTDGDAGWENPSIGDVGNILVVTHAEYDCSPHPIQQPCTSCRMIQDADFAVEARDGFALPIVSSGTGVQWDASVREPGNCVCDAAETNPDRRWKLYFTGRDSSFNCDIGVAFFPNGRTGWAKHTGNPIIDLGEDPYIPLNKDGTLHRDSLGRMHMFTEEKFAGGTPRQNGIKSPHLHRRGGLDHRRSEPRG